MWLIEKDPNDEFQKKYFPLINTNKIIGIITTNENGNNIQYCIKFYCEGINLKWCFHKEKDRNNYFEKIIKKLPKLELNINDISL